MDMRKIITFFFALGQEAQEKVLSIEYEIFVFEANGNAYENVQQGVENYKYQL